MSICRGWTAIGTLTIGDRSFPCSASRLDCEEPPRGQPPSKVTGGNVFVEASASEIRDGDRVTIDVESPDGHNFHGEVAVSHCAPGPSGTVKVDLWTPSPTPSGNWRRFPFLG